MNRDIEARGLIWFHAGFGMWNSSPVAVALPRLPCVCDAVAVYLFSTTTERRGIHILLWIMIYLFFRISVDMYLDNSCLQAVQEARWQQHLEFKETVHPKINSPRLFSWKLQSFGDISCCNLLLNIMEVTLCLRCSKHKQQRCVFPEVMTRLLKITRPCCEKSISSFHIVSMDARLTKLNKLWGGCHHCHEHEPPLQS